MVQFSIIASSAPSKTHQLNSPSTQSQPYHIPIQKPNAPAVHRMTRMDCTNFANSIQAVEKEAQRVRDLFRELREHLLECALNDTVDNLRNCMDQMHTFARDMHQHG